MPAEGSTLTEQLLSEFPAAFGRFLIGQDGIVECVTAAGHPFGYLRIDTLLNGKKGMPLNELCRHFENIRLKTMANTRRGECMQQPNTFLALFSDDRDRRLWLPSLADLEGCGCLTANGDLAALLRQLHDLAAVPEVILMSSDFFAKAPIDSITAIAARRPGSCLVMTMMAEKPQLPLQRLLSCCIPRVVVVAPPAGLPCHGFLSRAIRELATGREMGIFDALKPGTSVHGFELNGSPDKESIVAFLSALLAGEEEEMEFMRQRAVLLADELLENALYGAPRQRSGVPLYAKGKTRLVAPGERIAFRCGFDGDTLVMVISDEWGSLQPEELVSHLARNETCDLLESASGRGLFIIWRFLDRLHVSILPGRETTIGGIVHRTRGDDLEMPKSFAISLCRGEAAESAKTARS